MTYALSTSATLDDEISSDVLDVGEIAQITKGGHRFEFILVMYDCRIVSLSKPSNTWGSAADLTVRRLPPGTSVTLTVD